MENTTINIILQIVLISYLIIFIDSIILMFSFKIFEKGKQNKTNAFVPIYNLLILNKICDVKLTKSLLFLVPVVNIIYFLYLEYKLSVSFKTSKVFYVGMIFIPIMFLPMLSFGDYKYKEEEQKIDEYMENVKDESQNLMTQKEIEELNKTEEEKEKVDSLFKSEWEVKEKPPMYKASTVDVDPEFSEMELFDEDKVKRVRPVKIQEIKPEPEKKENTVKTESDSIEIVEL